MLRAGTAAAGRVVRASFIRALGDLDKIHKVALILRKIADAFATQRCADPRDHAHCRPYYDIRCVSWFHDGVGFRLISCDQWDFRNTKGLIAWNANLHAVFPGRERTEAEISF